MEEPRRLGDRYEIGAVLGRGGMAEVYLGRDIRLGRSVAVKTLRVDLARDPSFQARFRREAQSAASLNHPAIVAVYDTGEDYIDGVSIPYIVMEYVDGSTLRELLHSGRRLLPERALEMTAGVLQALEYSHRNGIIHRDIKPANVMLTRQGTVKVMDFGIARAMADNGMTMTQTAAVIGTAQYLSPEQARGETVDARTDLYSTGCLLYELLTERPPFVGDSPVAVAYQHVREDPLPPSTFDPEVSPTIDAIVLKSLAKNPDNRYQSADEMRADIERALHGLPVGAPTVMSPMGDAATQYLPPTPAAGAGAGATQIISPGAHQAGGPPTTGAYQVSGDGRDEPPPRRSRGGAWILLTVGFIAVLVAAFFIGKILMGGDDKTTSAPDLVGKTRVQAEEAAGNLSLKLSVEAEKKSCDKPEGQVCEQNPAAGEKVDRESIIRVWLSEGPKTVKVPADLEGMDESEAREALKALNLEPVVERMTSNSCKQDTVCSASPEPGTEVKQGDKVTLKISSGKATHEMPSVVGLQYSDAVAQLRDLDLKVLQEQEYNAQPKGTVISQSLRKGNTVVEGTEITLTVSNGPAPQTTPPASTTPPTTQTPPPSGPPSTTAPGGGPAGAAGGGAGGAGGGGTVRGNQGWWEYDD